MPVPQTNQDAETLALRALAWALGDARRADRLLGLTGLTAADLRARAAEPALQAAVLAFLEAHEPDLTACAAELDVAPERLVAARAELER
jgi:hypothetical protein